jgi:hypothetical protein
MKIARDSLIDVLEEAKRLIAIPGNDFAWSSWRDKKEALSEIDVHIAKVRLGDHVTNMHLDVVFAPTGPLQELSLSSGWADEFLKLASRFDAVKNA